MFEEWCSFCHKKGSLVLKICVNNLVEYLDSLQEIHDYAFTTLCMHASTIWSIVQPTDQSGASMTSLFKQPLKGVFRKSPLARIWADTCVVKKVLDLLHACGKPSALNYTHLNLKTVRILALATVKRSSDLNLLKITPKAMQITEDSVTFQLVFGAQNARPNCL